MKAIVYLYSTVCVIIVVKMLWRSRVSSPQIYWCQRQRTGFFFVRWERDQDHDSKKEQEFYITSGNLIGLVPKMSVSDWLLQQQTAYHKNSESSEASSSWTFIHENTNSTLSRIIIGIAWLIAARSVVWIFMYNGKVAYQIARVVAIEIKKIVVLWPVACSSNSAHACIRSLWAGACNSTIFLSRRLHRPIYF